MRTEGTASALAYKASVVENEELNHLHQVLTFEPLLKGAPMPRPGQFYMITAGAYPEPLLKRPFCGLSHEGGRVKLLYRVKGKGTRLLREMKPGAKIDVLGPLGNSYPEPPSDKHPVVIAGGIGIASLYPFIESLKGRASVIYGSRSKEDIMLYREVEALAGRLTVCTDDCTFGEPGTVIDVLNKAGLPDNSVIYACGPKGMLRAVKAWMKERGLSDGYASLEEHMACGIGACMGCVVLTESGYKRVCKEGPVFPIMEVIF